MFFPTLLLLAVGMTIGVGTATITSIKLGQKKYDDAEKVLGQAFFLFAVFCILVALYMLNFMGINVKEDGSDNISDLFCGRRVDRGASFFLC